MTIFGQCYNVLNNRAVCNWVSKVISRLLWFCINTLCDWLTKRSTNGNPKQHAWRQLHICFEFWLVRFVVYICCDWPEKLLWFWFYDTQLETALMQHVMKLSAVCVFFFSHEPQHGFSRVKVESMNTRMKQVYEKMIKKRGLKRTGRWSWLLVPEHGARVRFLLGTNVNALIYQVSTPEFGHGISVPDYKVATFVFGHWSRLVANLEHCYCAEQLIRNTLGHGPITLTGVFSLCYILANEYVLEKLSEPGVPINLESTLESMGTMEFCLVRNGRCK